MRSNLAKASVMAQRWVALEPLVLDTETTGLGGVLGIFRPKTTKCSGGRAVRGLQRGITFR